MKKDTLYKIIIGLLLIINLIQLTFSLIGPHHPPRHHHAHGKIPINKHLIETLNLSNEQFQDFNKLARQHREEMIILNDIHKKNTESYFNTPSDSMLNEINKIGTRKITVTSKHFEDINSLLNEDQKESFDEFKLKALSHIIR